MSHNFIYLYYIQKKVRWGCLNVGERDPPEACTRLLLKSGAPLLMRELYPKDDARDHGCTRKDARLKQTLGRMSGRTSSAMPRLGSHT
jgi:hypothetical protein